MLNTKESIDGQWYIFLMDGNETMIAHAANPDLVDGPAAEAVEPNNHPAGSAVAAAADQFGSGW